MINLHRTERSAFLAHMSGTLPIDLMQHSSVESAQVLAVLVFLHISSIIVFSTKVLSSSFGLGCTCNMLTKRCRGGVVDKMHPRQNLTHNSCSVAPYFLANHCNHAALPRILMPQIARTLEWPAELASLVAP